MAQLMLSVMGALAEFERAFIRDRQREGIALATQRRVVTVDQVRELQPRAQAGGAKTRLAKAFGISRETVYHTCDLAHEFSGHRVSSPESDGHCR